ncbi:unnamed protein product, partial [Lymnaea stagnalis]
SCRSTCSKNCLETNKCNTENGHCIGGCQDGYMQPLCTECESGRWGPDCKSNCSQNCLLPLTCAVENGTCIGGCSPGFVYPLCTQVISQTSNRLNPVNWYSDSIKTKEILYLTFYSITHFNWRKKDDGVSQSNHLGQAYNKPHTVTLISRNEGVHKFSGFKTVGQTQNAEVHFGAYLNVSSADISKINTFIRIMDLNTFLKTHNKQFFVKQFESVPVPQNVTTEVGLNNLNRNKNRYKDIVPYDHSRVHLEINTDDNEGDYINASYVEGYTKAEKFIASQGPNIAMVNDFIRMLWEQQVDKVVMLTNLIEHAKAKCERYWPDEGEKEFGGIRVKLSTTQVCAEYTIRRLELRKSNEQVQHATQFHFTSWPDTGVPKTPWSLVDFEQRVAAEPTEKPIVVHCSAGVGRTGTFIALCNVMSQAKDTGGMDFFQTLVKLRNDRMLMIQTEEQYEFLHRAAQVALLCLGTTVTA